MTTARDKDWSSLLRPTTNFLAGEDEVPKTMTTYKREDGEPICGEYSFVTELEWFESDDEPTELVKETWVLVSSENITYPLTSIFDEEDEE
jgi:hypothetical protein